MSTHTYQVIYKGEILAGFEKETVFRNVADIMAISAESAIEIVSGSRMVLKKGLDEATARSQCILLKKAGLRVALDVPPPGPMAEPSGALPPVQAKTPVFSKAPTPMDAAVAPAASFKV
jgi:hypothetical protein